MVRKAPIRFVSHVIAILTASKEPIQELMTMDLCRAIMDIGIMIRVQPVICVIPTLMHVQVVSEGKSFAAIAINTDDGTECA